MGNFFKDKIFVILLSVVIGVFIAMKYLSPLIAPFIFSFLIVSYLNPRLEKIQRRLRLKKGFVAMVIICVVLAVVILLGGFLIQLAYQKIMEALSNLDEITLGFEEFVKRSCESLETRFGFDGTHIETFIIDQVNIQIENLEINIMPKLMGGSLLYLRNIIGFFAFLLVLIISILLLLKDYDKIIDKARNYKQFYGVVHIGRKVVEYIRTFLRAQIIILGLISLICSLTLWFLGIRGGIVIGIITGILEALPFIGTGIVLIPLTLILIFEGAYFKAVACLILYAACAFLRELLAPRLIGGKVGIWPVCILLAVYVGINLFGLLGIVKGPISLVIICETYRYLKENRGETCQTACAETEAETG
jgi:sporulation integral membrane protein YtvI